MFHALPVDLQVHILSTWVAENNETGWHHTLSLLEVAGGKPLLSTLQACFAFPFTVSSSPIELSLSTFHGFDGGDMLSRERKLSVQSASYLCWLSQRQVPVRALYLQCLPDKRVCLPTVERIVLLGKAAMRTNGEDWANCMMGCPKLVSIKSDFCHNGKEFWTPPLLEEEAGAIITHTVEWSGTGVLEMTVVRALEAIGCSLQVLRLKTASDFGEIFWDTLAASCPLLRVLEVEMHPVILPAWVLGTVTGCPTLQDLTLHCFDGSQHDIDTIIQAGQSLVRFSVYLGFEMTGCRELVHVPNTYPTLDLVRMKDFCGYQRSERSLLMCSIMDASEAGLVLAACGVVTKLWLEFEEEHDLEVLPLLTEIVSKCCHTLMEFTLICCTEYDEEDLLFIPLHCPSIRRIVFHIEIGHLTDHGLQQLAAVCKELQCLVVDSGSDCGCLSISDAGLMALFAGCPALKEVRMTPPCPLVTFQSLQAIVDHRLSLKSLCLSGVGFDKEDAERFRRMARDCQLLPVPRLVVT